MGGGTILDFQYGATGLHFWVDPDQELRHFWIRIQSSMHVVMYRVTYGIHLYRYTAKKGWITKILYHKLWVYTSINGIIFFIPLKTLQLNELYQSTNIRRKRNCMTRVNFDTDPEPWSTVLIQGDQLNMAVCFWYLVQCT